ncbi:MAG: hypothetical protein N3F09_04005 [Bacteroidia bacterium]|nr:hypothetical protein [Bacteroidia bacterium]
MSLEKQNNILVTTFWDFDDALIQTYTLPYLNIMANILPENSKIYMLTLNKSKHDLTNKYNHPKIKILFFKYFPIGIKACIYYTYVLIYLLVFIKRNKIGYIHSWGTPSGFFGYILSKLSGKNLILDSFEPHAESMLEVGEWKRNSWVFRLLFSFEKKMTHHAKYIIATTEGMMKEYAKNKFGFNPDNGNWFVKPACVDLEKFRTDDALRNHWRKKFNLENKIIGIYAGKFGGIYLEDDVFRFLKVAQEFWKDKFVFILLTPQTEEYIKAGCKKFNVDFRNIIHRFVPHHEVVSYMNMADFAITPVKPVPTKKYCTPIKNGEYWAMSLPVLIPMNISDDSEIIENENIGYVWKNLSEDEFKNSLFHLQQLFNTNYRERIRNVAIRYRNYDIAKNIYNKIYTS